MTTLVTEAAVAAIVTVVGHVPCGCGHCEEFDLSAGNLIEEVHIGIGGGDTEELAALAAVNDALEQAYERHPHGELAVECYTLIP